MATNDAEKRTDKTAHATALMSAEAEAMLMANRMKLLLLSGKWSEALEVLRALDPMIAALAVLDRAPQGPE